MIPVEFDGNGWELLWHFLDMVYGEEEANCSQAYALKILVRGDMIELAIESRDAIADGK